MRRHEQGLALITVMLVLALAVIAATEMASRLNFSLRRAENWQWREQGKWYALGAEALARQVLEDDAKGSPGRTDLSQNWAQSMPTFPVDEVLISGQLSDLHACFNLNALAELPPNDAPADWEPVARAQLQHLLESQAINPFDAEAISYALLDWIDADQQIGAGLGAEDSEYASYPIPYLTPNTPLSWLSEIRPVRGIGRQQYQQLRQLLCVRPGDQRQALNLNTLPLERAEVLSALLQGQLGEDEISALLERRPDGGHETVDAWLAEPELAGLEASVRNALKALLVVRSDDFLLVAQIAGDTGTVQLETIFRRTEEDAFTVQARRYGSTW